jgi:Bacterial Ig-like domain (group 3)
MIAGILCVLIPAIAQAQTTCPVAQMISPTNGSTLPAGAVTFEWCNASADYFLTIESVPGAHDIFFAFAGGVGPGAGVISVTLGPACAPGTPTGCIPPNGETIFVTLDTVRSKTIIGSFQYTYTAANSTPPGPIVTTTAVDNKTTTFSNIAQNITLTATVNAASTVNQGTVTFQVKDGASNVGSAVTSGTLTAGSASVIYALPPGTPAKNYTIQAAYSGGPNFQASTSAGTLTVNAAPPTITPTTTTVDNKAATFNSAAQSVNLTATVAAASTVNQGTVTFQVLDGLSNIGSAVTSGTMTTGSASVIYLLPAGTTPKNYTIQAAYSGGSNFQSSNGSGFLTVNAVSPTQSPTTTTVDNKTATFSSMDQNVTLTATVASASTVNQGTVSFQLMDGANSVGNVVNSGTLTTGAASVSYLLPAGMTPKNYTIKAAYSGGPDFQASNGTGTQAVTANSTITMTLPMPQDGTSATSSGLGALAVNYGQMNSSMTTNPVAIANFGYSIGGAGTGALVTEAGVPAASVVTAARLFVDYNADTNSGFALVNPNGIAIPIRADLKDAKGITIASTNIPLGPRSHTAMFVNQLLPAVPSPFLGTVTLTSLSGFAAVNLSTATSGRQEMLFSALPVADLGNPPKGTRLILSQIVDGGGNPTQIMLMNPSGTTPSVGKVQLFDDNGAPLALDFGSPSGAQDTLDFTLAPDGMAKFATTGTGALRVGYAVVTVTSGPLPVGNGIFQFRQSLGLVSQAGVPDSPSTTSARLYVEVASAPLSRNTGIAIVNRNATSSTLTLTLKGFDGSTQVATLNLGPNAHSAQYVTQIFTGLPANFSGVLNITGTQPNSFLTLRQTINERGENIWSTLPVADLNNPPLGIQILPQIVNGGGYKTESIIISTSASLGTVYINFFDEGGSSVPLNLLF